MILVGQSTILNFFPQYWWKWVYEAKLAKINNFPGRINAFFTKSWVLKVLIEEIHLKDSDLWNIEKIRESSHFLQTILPIFKERLTQLL